MDRLSGDDDVVLGDGDGRGAGPLAVDPLAPRSGLAGLARHPATLVVGAVALAFAVGAGAGLLGGDDEPGALPVASPSPSPSPEPSPSPASPPPTSATPTPGPSPAVQLDPSCAQDAPSEAVCRFVRALQTGELSGLTEGERALAEPETDVPDAAFSVASCELEGDVTVLCEVRFDDPEQIAAGFRLQPSNGAFDAETGEVVVEPGQTLAYEVVELVGMRRDAPPEPAPAPPPPPSAAPEVPELVLGGEDLGVTRIGAPAEEAVQAVARVLGPPVRDPATSVACIGASREVEWTSFRLALDGDDRVSGWLSRDRRLRTPSGFGIGTTVAQMQSVVGDDLSVFEPNPDNGATFAVEGVDLGGGLTGTGPSGRVEVFFTSACAGP